MFHSLSSFPSPVQLFSHIPEVDLQCSGSELHMMFCVDSCSVFRDLMIYLAENRDLKEEIIEDNATPVTTTTYTTVPEVQLHVYMYMYILYNMSTCICRM